jgi:hypothetical protein
MGLLANRLIMRAFFQGFPGEQVITAFAVMTKKTGVR